MGALVDLIRSGGPILAILAVLSVLSIALIFYKGLQLGGVLSGKSRQEGALKSWAGGDKKTARAAVGQGGTPADRILGTAMDGLIAGHPRGDLDSDLEWRGNAEMAAMSQYIRVLELVAMVSPLLGLLGTVLGMIEAFQELSLAQGSANASILAAGIWQALLTTAAGLVVAIPAAIGASLLNARVESVGQRMEASVGRLFAIESRRD